MNDQSIKRDGKTSANPEEGLTGGVNETLGKESGYEDPQQEKPQGEGASWMGGSEQEGGATTKD